jgi:hypothetical protein
LFIKPGEVVSELAGVDSQGHYEWVALPEVGSSMLVAALSPGCLSCTERGQPMKTLFQAVLVAAMLAGCAVAALQAETASRPASPI